MRKRAAAFSEWHFSRPGESCKLFQWKAANFLAVKNTDEWSTSEVLAHLRACADVWGTCIMRIIEEDRPTWRAVNPRTWIKRTDYPEQEFRPSLGAFTTQRTALLAVLEPLPIDAWERSARVSGAGKVLEPTVLSYGERQVVHERSHMRQIERMVKTMQG